MLPLACLLSQAWAITCPSGYAVQGRCVPKGVSPLDYYVNHVDDGAYHYDPTPMQVLEFDNATAYVLNMTSQKWLLDENFQNISAVQAYWIHQVVVIVPKVLKTSAAKTGWVWITGGENEAQGNFKNISTDPKASDRGELKFSLQMAVATGTVAVVLKQVPNQPIKFAHELPDGAAMYPNGRTEDGIIAYGWHQFIYNEPATARADWLLRLPMTKAVSKAMDTVQHFMANSKHVSQRVHVGSFVVGGASKRGWTTWTTGLVDDRCVALVPVVMDLLHMRASTDVQFKALGGWTFEYEDYIAAKLLGSKVENLPSYMKMTAVNDAYSYFTSDADAANHWPSHRFKSLPKLVCNGGNDEFFMPDDNHYWWGQLPGEKHLLHLPNADHGFEFWPPTSPLAIGLSVFQASLTAFYSAVVTDTPRPQFTWTMQKHSATSADAEAATITVGNFSQAPLEVSVWSSTTDNGHRDWRLFDCRTGQAVPGVPFGGRNCTKPEDSPAKPTAGGPSPHPLAYTRTILHPTTATTTAAATSTAATSTAATAASTAAATAASEWTVTVKAPADGNYTTFFVDAIFPHGNEGTAGLQFHFTTQMAIVPDKLPYDGCDEYGEAYCTRLV